MYKKPWKASVSSVDFFLVWKFSIYMRMGEKYSTISTRSSQIVFFSCCWRQEFNWRAINHVGIGSNLNPQSSHYLFHSSFNTWIVLTNYPRPSRLELKKRLLALTQTFSFKSLIFERSLAIFPFITSIMYISAFAWHFLPSITNAFLGMDQTSQFIVGMPV